MDDIDYWTCYTGLMMNCLLDDCVVCITMLALAWIGICWTYYALGWDGTTTRKNLLDHLWYGSIDGSVMWENLLNPLWCDRLTDPSREAICRTPHDMDRMTPIRRANLLYPLWLVDGSSMVRIDKTIPSWEGIYQTLINVDQLLWPIMVWFDGSIIRENLLNL